MTPTPGITSTAAAAASAASDTPWWAIPLLAGFFVCIGAAIAFTSTYFSDRRKLQRDDQRQWDKEIRDAYVAVVPAINEFARTRHLGTSEPSTTNRDLYDTAGPLLDEIEKFVSLVNIIGQPETVEAAQKLLGCAYQILGQLHDHILAPKDDFRQYHADSRALFVAVKKNLRVPHKSNR